MRTSELHDTSIPFDLVHHGAPLPFSGHPDLLSSPYIVINVRRPAAIAGPDNRQALWQQLVLRSLRLFLHWLGCLRW